MLLSDKLSKTLLRTTENYIKALEKGGIITIVDLLNHFPRDYDDRTNVLNNFSLLNVKEKNTVLVKLLSISSQKTGNNKLLTKAVLEDKNGFLSEAVWFNRKYLSTQLKSFENKKIIISGKVKYSFGKVTFQSPETETDLEKISGEIVPIYPEINYIPSKWIEGKMILLKNFIKDISEDLPEEILKKYGFISRRDAITRIHFPKNKQDIEQAQYRLAYSELFDINFRSIGEKYENFKNSEGKSIATSLNPEKVKEILSFFPFEFTNHQKISLFQILKDMEKTHCMQRLLEGDVGTGKTAVAFVGAVHFILENRKNQNVQVAIMAPTEILARQHFGGMQNFLLNFGISSELLVGSLTEKQKKSVKQKLKNGTVDLVIGTHALVQEDVEFANLGFVVVDEQHRFGVKQRETLEKGFGNKSGIIPHNLNMTATPIPRTLALTLYGDQDLSIISEYPKGRKEIFTKVAKNEEQRLQIENFVRAEVEKGRQAFWISPLVEESEKVDLANAINTWENLKEIFFPFKVGLLHGKMKPKEKDQIMQEFVENKIQILSSTSVVEVGVDVPNSTIMCIEGAERFGLSQLHQFRGRVGRGAYQSYCYLFPTKGQYTDRLKAMERTNNGFELAEIDLELRGPGEVYGIRQSGIPDLKIAKLTDLELISQIREDIEEIFEKKKISGT
ncbi:ATP-dependent DNA helicase RecG [Candidatus Gracilibacteria bacterium]|nr:MAG: ATP-dependent DNA helicase RecG [Candidatus Gracilibacteria bacterium]